MITGVLLCVVLQSMGTRKNVVEVERDSPTPRWRCPVLSTQRKSSPHLISEGRHHSSKQLTLQISQYVFAGDIELHFQSHIRKYEILRQARF